MGRERGVVAAAVIHMQDECGVQRLGLQFREVSVRTQDMQNILRKAAVLQRRYEI